MALTGWIVWKIATGFHLDIGIGQCQMMRRVTFFLWVVSTSWQSHIWIMTLVCTAGKLPKPDACQPRLPSPQGPRECLGRQKEIRTLQLRFGDWGFEVVRTNLTWCFVLMCSHLATVTPMPCCCKRSQCWRNPLQLNVSTLWGIQYILFFDRFRCTNAVWFVLSSPFWMGPGDSGWLWFGST